MKTPPVLEELSEASLEASMQRRAEIPPTVLIERTERWRDRDGCFGRALAAEGMSVIAEYKQASPSEGSIRDATPETIAELYAPAAAISVLTEKSRFGGSLENLAALRELTDLPLLRKDFITHPYQLLEAKAAGADAALLIASKLDTPELQLLREYAEAFGLDALVEVHDREDLDRAVRASAKIIGINNRDLRAKGLPTNTVVTGRLLDAVPQDVIVVTESGFGLDPDSRQQLRKYNARGVDAVLIGTELMRSHDPTAAIELLKKLGCSRSTAGNRFH
ncbi:MAG: indole-3-glycerol phosphate synthase TrpC [bacterium]|nr:indole-3-glycerol phosphate synthase TrpC [bacterium]MDZ4248135.1 indole-3-glycerol phosphate synthase TrpC [Patescibacteria group bacterium]